jgi:hypothetical protein
MSDSRFPQILDEIEWNFVKRATLVASTGSDNLFLPIAPVEVPITNSRLLAVGVGSVQSRSSWKFGGRASQSYDFTFSSTSVFRRLPTLVETKPLRLFALNLLVFELKLPEYTLVLDFPAWFRDVEYEVWRYDGLESDLHQKMDALNQQINEQA